MCVLQYRVHHLGPGVSSAGVRGGSDRQERLVGYAGRNHYAPLSHDAGLHLLEPLDRNVSVRSVVFAAGLCSVAHGGVRGARASAGNRVWIYAVHTEPGPGAHGHGCGEHLRPQRIPVPRGLLHRLPVLGSAGSGSAVSV